MEGNLWEGMYSFDNTLNALVLMFLIITASNWNLLMYRLQETEISYVAPLYFAAGILVRARAAAPDPDDAASRAHRRPLPTCGPARPRTAFVHDHGAAAAGRRRQGA